MANQLTTDIIFTNTAPNNYVDGPKMTSAFADLALLNGGVINQATKTLALAADLVLMGDSTQAASGLPYAIQLQNLLLDKQQNGTAQYVATDTGTANTYAVTLPYTTASLQAGMVLRFKPAHANTGASTIAVTSNATLLATPTIKNRAQADLSANDIITTAVVTLVYDGTYFQLVTAISAGEILAAMAAENFRNDSQQFIADTGSATAYAATLVPAATAYAAGMVVRFKALHSNTGAATLNVNALGAIAINKVVVASALAALVANDILQGDIVTCVYDGTEFILSGRVRSWDFTTALANSNTVPYTALATGAGGVKAVAHGLGFTPTKVRVVLYCVATDRGYTGGTGTPNVGGDEVSIESAISSTTGEVNFNVGADATNITITNLVAAPFLMPKTGGGYSAIAATTDWNLKVYASL